LKLAQHADAGNFFITGTFQAERGQEMHKCRHIPPMKKKKKMQFIKFPQQNSQNTLSKLFIYLFFKD
jgi:hypothetical protein